MSLVLPAAQPKHQESFLPSNYADVVDRRRARKQEHSPDRTAGTPEKTAPVQVSLETALSALSARLPPAEPPQPALESTKAPASKVPVAETKVEDTKTVHVESPVVQHHSRPTADPFAQYTTKQLRDMCKNKGFKVSGKRQELVDRLM